MTEPRIAAALETGADHVEAVTRWADEIAELRDWIAGGSVLDLRRALDRADRLADEIGLAVLPLARAFPKADAEQTDVRLPTVVDDPPTAPIIVTHGYAVCSTCHGTGEIPIVEVRP